MRDEPSPLTPARLLVAGCLLAVVGLALPAASQGDGNDPPIGGSQVLPAPAGGTADSNSRMIAVTGVDLTGSAVLYLVDTVNPHIAVYQATGGSEGTRGIQLVAARRIDLDLSLDGLNDRSKYKYKELEDMFASQGLLPEK